MWKFVPVPESNPLLGVFERMRKDISHNTFHINPHANVRMVDRGIGIEDIKDSVLNGQMGQMHRIEGLITCCFVRKHIVVVVSKPFGEANYHAAPTIVTVFRDDDNYEPTLDELTIAQTVVEKVVEKVVIKNHGINEMSIEELQEFLDKKKQNERHQKVTQAEANIGRCQAAIEKLDENIAQIRTRRAELADELNGYKRLLGQRTTVSNEREEGGTYRGGRSSTYTREQIEAAVANPVRKQNGRFNLAATAEKHGIAPHILKRAITRHDIKVW